MKRTGFQRLIAMLLIGAVLALCAGCGKKSMVEKRLVGEWYYQSTGRESDDDEFVFDPNVIYVPKGEKCDKVYFYEDGAFETIEYGFTEDDEDEIVHGTYSILNDGEKLEMVVDDYSQVWEMEYHSNSDSSKDTFLVWEADNPAFQLIFSHTYTIVS